MLRQAVAFDAKHCTWLTTILAMHPLTNRGVHEDPFDHILGIRYMAFVAYKRQTIQAELCLRMFSKSSCMGDLGHRYPTPYDGSASDLA